MVEMMQMNSCRGVRVGEITKRTHLSRPAVSHHLQILREAGILGVRKAPAVRAFCVRDAKISYKSFFILS